MAWVVRLSREALKDYMDLPQDMWERVERAIEDMRADPFQGDVKALKGKEWKGCYRKRVGPYRIVFTVDHKQRVAGVTAIVRRSEKTYR